MDKFNLRGNSVDNGATQGILTGDFITALDKENLAYDTLVDALYAKNSMQDPVIIFRKPGTTEKMIALTDKLKVNKLYPIFDLKFNVVFAVKSGGHSYLIPYLTMYHKKAEFSNIYEAFDAYTVDKLGFYISSFGNIEYNRSPAVRYSGKDSEFIEYMQNR